MPRRFSVLLSLLLVVIFAAIFFLDRQSTAAVLFESGKSIRVEVVTTVEDQTRGLAGHAPLDDQHGMLFVWNEPAPREFWMKDMTFPIDIFWIRDGVIVGITSNVPPPNPSDTEFPRHASPVPVDTVLETAAGFATSRDLFVGQIISIQH